MTAYYVPPGTPYLGLYNGLVPPCFVRKPLFRNIGGIGPRKISLLNELGIFTVEQLVLKLIEEESRGIPAEVWLQGALGYRNRSSNVRNAIRHIRLEQQSHEHGINIVTRSMSLLRV